MRLLLISPFPPPVGGIATWTVRYEQYCRDHKISVSIVNNALIGKRKEKRNTRLNILNEMYRSGSIIKNLMMQILKKKPDLIHLNTSCSRLGIYRDWICVMISRLFSIPVVLQCHCNIEDQIHGHSAERAFMAMASMCNRVLVLNRFSAKYAKCHAAKQVMVVPNFTSESNLFVREKYQETIHRAVFVGHVRREKGAVEIFEAAAHFPGIRFIMVGPVQKEMEELPHSDNVELLGSQPHEKVLELLKEADVFLFPSHTEGFANALLEAMAVGLPIIATDVGANAEMIENEGGIIIPARDSDAIVGAFKQLQEDSGRRFAMGTWNTQKVKDEYLLDVVMKQLLNIYSSIC